MTTTATRAILTTNVAEGLSPNSTAPVVARHETFGVTDAREVVEQHIRRRPIAHESTHPAELVIAVHVS